MGSRHETERQNDKQQYGEADPNRERADGALRFAAIMDQKIEAKAETDDNAKHGENDKNI
jgi:hypothetical protein